MLRGIVGSTRITGVGDTKILRMTVATNRAFKAKDGTAVIETTWHMVTAFPGPDIAELDSLSKADKVEVTGRISNQRVCGEDGVERTVSEIRATSIRKLDTGECLQYEM
jgi:Single-stranded DNA-binding protein